MAEVLIPIVAFLSMAAVLISLFYLKYKSKIGVLKTIQKSIDSGTPLTPELLEKMSNVQPPRVKDLRRGVVLSALGLAILAASFFVSHSEPQEALRIISMLPLFVGAGFLLVWKLNRYKD